MKKLRTDLISWLRMHGLFCRSTYDVPCPCAYTGWRCSAYVQVLAHTKFLSWEEVHSWA